jgi:hypothetical protein
VKSKARGLVLLIFVLAVALLGGAGSSTASTQTQCNQPDPTGRQFCVTVTDSDGVSPSGPIGSGSRKETVTAYQFYNFTVQNVAGTSTLTNGKLSVVLTDNFPAPTAPANSTALFVPSGSSPGCTVVSTSPNRVDCTLPNLAAGSQPITITLAYRTSTSANVISTDANVTTSFKEGTNPNGANPSSLNFTENTSLEPDPETSLSWSPPGQSTSLGTSPTFDSQFSVLAFNVPPGHAAFTSTLSEGAGTLCDGVHTCFGEQVTAHLPADSGTFSTSNPFHLTITLVPSDFNVNINNTSSVVVVHQPDSGPAETISTRCSSNPPPTSPPPTLPCIVVTKVNPPGNAPKLLVIDLYGVNNGGYHTGF